jgi:hypothetical protein
MRSSIVRSRALATLFLPIIRYANRPLPLHSVIQTDMGNTSCQYFGWPGAPVKVQDSVDGLLKQVRNYLINQSSVPP